VNSFCARSLLKNWFLENKQLELEIKSQLQSRGYLVAQVDLDQDQIFPKTLRKEDIHVSVDGLLFFCPQGTKTEARDNIEATLMALCLGWSPLPDTDSTNSSEHDEKAGQEDSDQIASLDIGELKEELKKLGKRLSKLEKKLEAASLEAKEKGQFPTRQLGNEIIQLVNSAEEFSDKISRLTHLEVRGTRSKEQFSVKAMKEVINTAEEAQASKKILAEKIAEAIRVLDIVDGLTSRSAEAEAGLQELKTKSSRIRESIKNSGASLEMAAVKDFLSGSNPIGYVVAYTRGEKLSDDQYRQIMSAFGSNFYNAMLRGEIGPFDNTTDSRVGQNIIQPIPVEESTVRELEEQPEEISQVELVPTDDQSKIETASKIASSILRNEVKLGEKCSELQWALVGEERVDVAFRYGCSRC